MKIKEIAEYLQNKFIENGFIVHRYDAHSTCSIYLKLDYGVMHSIRISNHKGKEKLSYKYEINYTFGRCGWYKDEKGFWRYCCTLKKEDIDNLVNMIIEDKIGKQQIYDYDKILEEYKEKSKNAVGFWQKCKQIKEEDCK